MTELACHGCGKPLVKNWTGRDPKWCSERCRKSQYAGTCVDCGAPTNGSDGRGSNAATRCARCSSSRVGALNGAALRARFEPEREAFVRRWNEDATLAELASEFGVSVGQIKARLYKLRSQGYDLPYRRPESVRAAITNGVRARAAA